MNRENYCKDGNKQLSLINKREDEGGWGNWVDKVPSQFLSKQTLQKLMLMSFANDCDLSAVPLESR